MAPRTSLERAARDLGGQVRDLIETHTFDPLLGEAWVELLLAPEPKPSAALAASLDLSEDDAAALLDVLCELGAARAEGGLYHAETDLLAVASGFVRARQAPLVEETEEAVRHARDLLAREADDAATTLSVRLDGLARQIALVRRLLDLFADRGARDLDKLLKTLQG